MMMPSLAAAQCTLNTQNQTVTICTPTNGSTVFSSPVHVVAGTTDSNTISYLQIYLDGIKVYEVKASSLDTNVPISTTGTHRLTVQAKDSAAQIFKTTVNVTRWISAASAAGWAGEHQAHILHAAGEPVARQLLREDGTVPARSRSDGSFRRVATHRFVKGQGWSHGAAVPYANHVHGEPEPGLEREPLRREQRVDEQLHAHDGFAVPSTIDPDGTRAMGYYDWNDLPYYYELAFQFATSDRFFSSVLAPTIPNRTYMLRERRSDT